jgi:Protein of unknown function (DUF2846)
MPKHILMFVVFALSAFGQSEKADLRAAAGCGPAALRFDARADKKQPGVTQPQAGKTLVYVIQQGKPLGADSAVTTRVGLDGNWVGANHGASYVSFEVGPGDHQVCVDWQSSLKGRQRLSQAVQLTAEAGQTYYLRAEVVMSQATESHEESLRLAAVDKAEGTLLLSKAGRSTWKARQ